MRFKEATSRQARHTNTELQHEHRKRKPVRQIQSTQSLYNLPGLKVQDGAFNKGWNGSAMGAISTSGGVSGSHCSTEKKKQHGIKYMDWNTEMIGRVKLVR